MRKELIILAVCCALLPGCRPGSAFRWTQRDGALCLTKGDSVVGRLDIAETEGISHSERTERLDGQTFSITCVFKAARDVEDARLQMGFTHLSPSSYWMIPAVSYNGKRCHDHEALVFLLWHSKCKNRRTISGDKIIAAELELPCICLCKLFKTGS